jgi:hypothetical protein
MYTIDIAKYLVGKRAGRNEKLTSSPGTRKHLLTVKKLDDRWIGEMVMAETQESRDVMTLKEVYEAGRPEEEGYDAPFATFTWRHWMASQARLNQCFSRFVRAVEERRAAQAMLIGLEVQEIATQMLVEAYSLSVNRPEETDEPRSAH